MQSRLAQVDLELKALKKQLANLWESKGKTDEEVLDLAGKIDLLLNEYDLLLKSGERLY
ncbi:MAG: aspartyl-phosphate phosphatase Spo0E family protein [Bacillota bacterium]